MNGYGYEESSVHIIRPDVVCGVDDVMILPASLPSDTSFHGNQDKLLFASRFANCDGALRLEW